MRYLNLRPLDRSIIFYFKAYFTKPIILESYENIAVAEELQSLGLYLGLTPFKQKRVYIVTHMLLYVIVITAKRTDKSKAVRIKQVLIHKR